MWEGIITSKQEFRQDYMQSEDTTRPITQQETDEIITIVLPIINS
jgi:hypothetical protein